MSTLMREVSHVMREREPRVSSSLMLEDTSEPEPWPPPLLLLYAR